eukprot:550137_1
MAGRRVRFRTCNMSSVTVNKKKVGKKVVEIDITPSPPPVPPIRAHAPVPPLPAPLPAPPAIPPEIIAAPIIAHAPVHAQPAPLLPIKDEVVFGLKKEMKKRKKRKMVVDIKKEMKKEKMKNRKKRNY